MICSLGSLKLTRLVDIHILLVLEMIPQVAEVPQYNQKDSEETHTDLKWSMMMKRLKLLGKPKTEKLYIHRFGKKSRFNVKGFLRKTFCHHNF